MEPIFNIVHGDALAVLTTLPDNEFQTAVTSPPYWKLRDYEEAGQLGGEDTPEEFVDKLVAVFRELRRTLRKDGTLWLNLGDTYCGGGGYWPNAPTNINGSKQSKNRGSAIFKRPVPPGYKPKDLAGVPWQVAIALRKDGWYLRHDIIWEKANCMPENVRDRPTRNHEYIFLLSKSKKYYYDPDALLEPSVEGGLKNSRSVWRMSKANGYKGAHFALFPLALPERCILAATRPGDKVLDPFSGAGTTGLAALKHGRIYTGIELHKSYVDLSMDRLNAALPKFEKTALQQKQSGIG
jgi:site-specific DNA-methyltransferase (cytosine-N4-specific)